MFEVEVKVRAVHESVRPALESQGAEELGSVEQVDTYYDAPHRNFKDTGEALRVRHEHRGDEMTSRLTYKGPLVDDQSKTREEFDTRLGESESTHAILDAFGFESVAVVEKERERFRIGRYTITLDAVTSLGEFVEVETEAPEAEIPSAREGTRSLLVDLGLEPAAGIRTSHLEMVLTGDDE
jgi:adenylate cyclase class 2